MASGVSEIQVARFHHTHTWFFGRYRIELRNSHVISIPVAFFEWYNWYTRFYTFQVHAIAIRYLSVLHGTRHKHPVSSIHAVHESHYPVNLGYFTDQEESVPSGLA